MAINHAQVRHIARLAHLDLDEDDEATLAQELQSILDHVALLDEVDEVDGIERIERASNAHPQPLRDDREEAEKPAAALDRALSNAPEHAAAHFRVPRVLDE